MKLNSLLVWFTVIIQVTLLVLITEVPGTAAQEPSFELPVELIGFPIIIVAVRLSNFVKKLAYSINPKTYASRSRRSIASDDDMMDMIEAEKKLVSEFGDNVCIYTRVCLHHAQKASRTNGRREMNIDWDEIFSDYKASQERHKEMYLLSVFLGDFIASPKFCNKLAKRGRACTE